MRLIPPLEPIRPHMGRVQRLLHDTATGVEEPLRSMLRHSLGGGKQLRPALVILVGQAFDAPCGPFYRLAAAVEMLHAATLIHDDLVDGALLRRGRGALHTLWPPGAIVLVGDYLLGEATALIAELGNPRVLEVFAGILRTMCAGEIKRMLTVGEQPHTSRPGQGHGCWEDYYHNIEAKTASLFAATMEMAAILAEAGEPQIDALRRFGRELGMAFQIVDDVLDFIGDEARLGKPAGSDLRQGLVTLPTLHYLERAEDRTPVNVVLSGQRGEEYVRRAVEAVCSSGAIEASLAEARTYAARCHQALTILPHNASRQMLCSVAEYVVERGH